MEKLDASKREAIKKMSNIRLMSKLIGAGVDEETIQAMGRPELLAAWAEIVAAGKDEPPIAARPMGYDPELEKQRLEFEIRKYEQEREERRVRENRKLWNVNRKMNKRERASQTKR